MKNIYLKTGQTQDVFNDLKDSFNGTLTSTNEEYNLTLASDFAEGNIKGKTLANGMTFIQFDMRFSDDVRISMESFMCSPIFFLYCSEGNVQHSFGVQGNKKNVKKNQTGVLKSTSTVNNIFYFQKDVSITFNLIGVETKACSQQQNTELIKNVKNTFFKVKEDYLEVSVTNLNTVAKLYEFNTIPQKGIVKDLLKARILESILELEIKNQMDGLELLTQNINHFVKRQFFAIKSVPDSIMKSAVLQAGQTFQSPLYLMHKVNEGFKFSYNRMMHNFQFIMGIGRQRI